MFPLRDHNPSQTTPVIVYTLIAINVIAFALTAGKLGNEAFLARWAIVPAAANPLSYVTSQFLHGGLLHLGGNMLFLWIFGDNLEERMGRLPFLAFYLASGIAAGLAQTISEPTSTIPMLGASGAVAGIMGGYLLLFPKARVDILVILLIFFRVFAIPAWIVLGLWFLIQLGSGAATPGGTGGVAYWAHAGGFLAGLALTVPLFLRLGGRAFWDATHGHPPHPEATYPTRRSPIPNAGRRK